MRAWWRHWRCHGHFWPTVCPPHVRSHACMHSCHGVRRPLPPVPGVRCAEGIRLHRQRGGQRGRRRPGSAGADACSAHLPGAVTTMHDINRRNSKQERAGWQLARGPPHPPPRATARPTITACLHAPGTRCARTRDASHRRGRAAVDEGGSGCIESAQCMLPPTFHEWMTTVCDPTTISKRTSGKK